MRDAIGKYWPDLKRKTVGPCLIEWCAVKQPLFEDPYLYLVVSLRTWDDRKINLRLNMTRDTEEWKLIRFEFFTRCGITDLEDADELVGLTPELFIPSDWETNTRIIARRDILTMIQKELTDE
ncbi:hypothetical protein GCM10011360_02700 [Primorskyibacter flagellatus]|uniref:Uncharacterized protein n=1 Tax=Primorskyibacter flagellatus TaxID=1387277 RepID=A0A917E9Y9_9RHOB|nr:hypothetical protein [Primorskyibacter flagellatus]GGE17339.1 hypothetical protein GCM10011360_02700 [Primorskyibacter flagellatus]